jgi:hypothetical protein
MAEPLREWSEKQILPSIQEQALILPLAFVPATPRFSSVRVKRLIGATLLFAAALSAQPQTDSQSPSSDAIKMEFEQGIRTMNKARTQVDKSRKGVETLVTTALAKFDRPYLNYAAADEGLDFPIKEQVYLSRANAVALTDRSDPLLQAVDVLENDLTVLSQRMKELRMMHDRLLVRDAHSKETLSFRDLWKLSHAFIPAYSEALDAEEKAKYLQPKELPVGKPVVFVTLGWRIVVTQQPLVADHETPIFFQEKEHSYAVLDFFVEGHLRFKGVAEIVAIFDKHHVQMMARESDQNQPAYTVRNQA